MRCLSLNILQVQVNNKNQDKDDACYFRRISEVPREPHSSTFTYLDFWKMSVWVPSKKKRLDIWIEHHIIKPQPQLWFEEWMVLIKLKFNNMASHTYPCTLMKLQIIKASIYLSTCVLHIYEDAHICLNKNWLDRIGLLIFKGTLSVKQASLLSIESLR